MTQLAASLFSVDDAQNNNNDWNQSIENDFTKNVRSLGHNLCLYISVANLVDTWLDVTSDIRSPATFDMVGFNKEAHSL